MIRALFLFPATLLLLAVACGGGKSPAPTTTATTVSGLAVQQTPGTEGTQRLAPSATQSSRPQETATPPAPTRALPTSSPAPTATPRPDGLEFHFGPGVSDFDRALIVRATEVTSELLSHSAELRPSTAVFAATSAQGLEEAFAAGALAQRWRSQGMARRMTQAVAEASYRGIVINTGHPQWLQLDATQRVRAVAHEFVHVVQLEQTGAEVADATLSGPVAVAPPAGPFWLLEGSAEVVSWLVLQELGLGSYPEPLFDYAAEASGSSIRLGELESFIGFRDGGREGLGLAVLATDYLLRSRSLDALFDFWREIGRGSDWTSSFIREFGQPPAFFYLAFAVYYDQTWAGFRP